MASAPSLARRFQPALPMRGVTFVEELGGIEEVFQPALPMRGVTRAYRRAA